MWLYALLLLGSIAIPLALSFDRKLQFYKQWKYLMPSIGIVAIVYILWDIYLTKLGVWGFNPQYHSNILLFKLPIEEWMFFIVIPYASIFLHDSLVLYFPKLTLGGKTAKALTAILIISLIAIILFNVEKIYTVYIFSFLAIALFLSLFDKTAAINSFFVSFLIILIPFIVVNALLTGTFIEGEVVWYNNSETLGIRFLTIPIEDFGYAFSLILFSILLRAKFKKTGARLQK